MVNCRVVIDYLSSYETPKIVTIRSATVGIISRIVQLTIICYIIGYVIIFKKGYQEYSDVESSVVTKVKGVLFTNFSDEEFNHKVKDPSLYRRIWDVSDYVIPASENGATFVATNVVITSNQNQTTCAEDIGIIGAKCDPDDNDCTAGLSLPTGNGVLTGKCVEYSKGNYSCEIQGWCPVENDVLPLKNGKALLAGGQNFTILIKNFVEFPKFKQSTRRNIKDTANKTYLQSCHFDEDNPECPVFRLGDIVEWAGQDYDDIALKGGIIAIIINWDCNLDRNKKYCFPKYSFNRLDDPNAKLAPGWNFRYANYYSDHTRTLYKLYGIKFAIIVQGQAGQFRIVPLLLNIGAGLGLLAVEVVVCDIVALYLIKKREYFKSKKYEEANPENVDFVSISNENSIPHITETPTILKPDNGYQRLEE